MSAKVKTPARKRYCTGSAKITKGSVVKKFSAYRDLSIILPVNSPHITAVYNKMTSAFCFIFCLKLSERIFPCPEYIMIFFILRSFHQPIIDVMNPAAIPPAQPHGRMRREIGRTEKALNIQTMKKNKIPVKLPCPSENRNLFFSFFFEHKKPETKAPKKAEISKKIKYFS